MREAKLPFEGTDGSSGCTLDSMLPIFLYFSFTICHQLRGAQFYGKVTLQEMIQYLTIRRICILFQVYFSKVYTTATILKVQAYSRFYVPKIYCSKVNNIV